jgi:4-aminobutyrate aminotransferase / (S)-3-amino-2-methylpropionate transaminase / 5-aminovalerate transaminase
VALREETAAQRVLGERARFVAPGVSTPALVVARAEGAWIEDVDGNRFLDFAGGIACQNLGHRHPAVVEAIQKQLDTYLHQCFMVGTYEPYVEVCRLLAELSPCHGEDQRSLLVNSGAEAIENAVKIARAATGRQCVVVFDNAFHGRTLLTMTMTSKTAYKRGFGPFAPEVYRVPAPYPYRGVSSDESIAALEHLFEAEVDASAVACVVLEPVQGEGGFIPMPPDFPARLRELCDRHGIVYVNDEVQSGCARTGPVWAIEHYDGVEPDLLVTGKSIGGGLPLAGVTGRAELVDSVAPGGLGGTFGGNPLACAAAVVVLETVATPEFRAKAEALGRRLRRGLDEIATRVSDVGEVRGLGPMLALELVEQTPDRAQATTRAAFEHGLLLLSCGLYGNVLRLLPPLTLSDDEADRGLELLEEALVAA